MAAMLSPARSLRFLTLCCCLALAVGGGGASLAAQEPPAPQTISPDQLQSAISRLGELDYASRTAASRTIRRTPAAQVVPALLRAVEEHTDGYVRYRALVLLTGFNDPRTKDAMVESLTSPNDRLRAVAYSYFERNPDTQIASRLLGALDSEAAEFVRPALVRALAALSAVPGVRPVLIRETTHGEDFFRSAVIEAMGDHKAQFAFDALVPIARLDGPLVADTALAIGKLGDPRGVAVLSALLQSAPKAVQPFVAAGICLLGVNCASHETFLVDTLGFADKNSGHQEALRASAAGLRALAVSGRGSALQALFEIGIAAHDPTRAPVSLAVATVALRNAPLMLDALSKSAQRARAITLLAEGFDMLEEDLEKERFFAAVRKTYWALPEGSPQRELMRTLISQLDF